MFNKSRGSHGALSAISVVSTSQGLSEHDGMQRIKKVMQSAENLFLEQAMLNIDIFFKYRRCLRVSFGQTQR